MEKKESILSGTETLEVIADANHFNKWMFETIKPYCKGEILEIGSGIGNISDFFINGGYQISLSDISNHYLIRLNRRFSAKPNFRNLFLFDFADANIEKNHTEMVGKFDTVFALNVLEHVPDHVKAIQNCYKLLKPRGKLVILVPAFQSLFNSLDVELEHQRRYTMNSLSEVFEKNNFKVVHRQYYNFMGIMGWYFSGKILKKKIIPSGQLKIYDFLVPVWKFLDFLMKNISGLSIIQVGEKME